MSSAVCLALCYVSVPVRWGENIFFAESATATAGGKSGADGRRGEEQVRLLLFPLAGGSGQKTAQALELEEGEKVGLQLRTTIQKRGELPHDRSFAAASLSLLLGPAETGLRIFSLQAHTLPPPPPVRPLSHIRHAIHA